MEENDIHPPEKRAMRVRTRLADINLISKLKSQDSLGRNSKGIM
jgi:hypothetical protein